MDPAKIKPMDRKTERALISRAQAGDQQAKVILLEQHNRWIWKVAINTKARGIDRDDMLQIGRLAFLEAVSRFDLCYDVTLSTYAYKIVAQKVHMQAFQCGNIWLPNGARTTSQKSVDATFQVGALENAELILRSRESGDLEKLCRAEDILAVRRAVELLPDRMRQIIEWRMNGQTLKEIGLRIGLVRERIRQIETEAMKILAGRLDAAGKRRGTPRIASAPPPAKRQKERRVRKCRRCGWFKMCDKCRRKQQQSRLAG